MDRICAQEELAFIRKVIADSRAAVADNGLDYIVWGLLVALGMFTSFIFYLTKLERIWGGWIYLILWIAVMGSGWAFSLIRHLTDRKEPRASTLGGRILKSLWLGCGAAIMIFIFIGGPAHRVDPSPAIAAVLGIGFFVSGTLLDFPLMRWSGALWWVASAGMFNIWWHFPQLVFYEPLIFGSLMILRQVIPGIILFRRWKQEAAELKP